MGVAVDTLMLPGAECHQDDHSGTLQDLGHRQNICFSVYVLRNCAGRCVGYSDRNSPTRVRLAHHSAAVKTAVIAVGCVSERP